MAGIWQYETRGDGRWIGHDGAAVAYPAPPGGWSALVYLDPDDLPVIGDGFRDGPEAMRWADQVVDAEDRGASPAAVPGPRRSLIGPRRFVAAIMFGVTIGLAWEHSPLVALPAVGVLVVLVFGFDR